MASESKPRWRDRFRNWRSSVSEGQPSHQTEQTALISALGVLRSSLDRLPPLQVAVGGLVECTTNLEIAEQNRRGFDRTIPSLTIHATFLQRCFVRSNLQSVPYSMENVARAINEQIECIRKQQDRLKVTRLASDEEAVLECYRQVRALFQQLWADISLGAWDVVQEQQMDTRLKDLLPVHDAYFNAALPTTATKRVGCTKNTRVGVLKAIRDWVRGANVPPIYWMNGMAGTGKTTIAYTICNMLHEDRQLGASFFCSRNSPDCRKVSKIVPTIAYQLGRYSNPYRRALCDVLNGDPDITKRDVTTQFEKLISKPLATMGKAMPDNVVVVIDALDECTDISGTKAVLNLLLQYANNLPIKFFVASRPEPAISNRMNAPDGALRWVLRLHDIERSLLLADIKTYLCEALDSIQITSDEIYRLIARAGDLFIFAATMVRYLINSNPDVVDPRERLQIVLQLPNQRCISEKAIDELCTTILSNALDENRFEQLEISRRRQALYAVVCAREPLTVSALAEILDMPNDQTAELAMQPLRSVLYVSESTKIVSTLHASFPNFLQDEERAGRFYCDGPLQSTSLTRNCFRVMAKSLRFNICALESSYRLDIEVPDLQNRIEKAISRALFYSCIYWGDHIMRSPFSSTLLSLLDSFMRHRLLFWLEVLNLNRGLNYGDEILRQALAWLPIEGSTDGLRDLIHDARCFVVTLASNPTSLSTPHIYASSLPFTSRRSHVWATYWPKTRGLVCVEGPAVETRGSPVLATWNIGKVVHSIAQSSDGKLVASGSGALVSKVEGPGQVFIWNALSGFRASRSLAGHRKHVHSVAFSPDDTRLVSSSSDHTIYIWDASNWELIAGPLQSHTSTVHSVAFSPDGNRLVSGSDDQTIRLWDAHTGAPLGEPLQGHQGGVHSAAFSPDGKHLASGSGDHMVRVWDPLAGATIQGPIDGHTDAVYSIAYSRDGRRLASGSADCTVRVWDILAGTLLTCPFEGHIEAVNSVSFSPDGTRVVSGSDDRTIRVWETTTGRLLAGPLIGHGGRFDGAVKSVLFSMDGTRILSGSDDQTIRVWDPRGETAGATKSGWHVGTIVSISLSPDGTQVASGGNTISIWDTRNGTLVTGPFGGHTNTVYSVAFSPDGAGIASGSGDHRWRIWDASTGALLVGPIKSHTGPGWVRSVVFSPDGSRIASGSTDGITRLWDSYAGESVVEPFKGHGGWVESTAFSPDGSHILSGFHLPRIPGGGFSGSFTNHAKEFTVRMWEINNGTVLWTSYAHTSNVNCVAFSPDGTKVVSASNDMAVLVLDARDGAVLHGSFAGCTHWGHLSLAFSLDGTLLISGSVDRTVCVWDVESCTAVAGLLKGHQGPVRSVASSPHGARIISASADNTIRVWDIAAAAATRASPTTLDNCSIDDNGWLTDSQSQRLLWVPSDLHERFGLLTPSNPTVINASCTARIDDTTLVGDRWHECYVGSAGSVSS